MRRQLPAKTTETAASCPLCLALQFRPYAQLHERQYLACDNCLLVWLDPAQRPDRLSERAYYATHENNPADQGYRRFLDRLLQPLMQRLPAGAHGLDYGCGPGPTLSVMLHQQGFPMAVYDPFFAPDREVLNQRYDFITCSETAEHFCTPHEEFARFDRLLRPGGWLGVMTGFLPDDDKFAGWHYTRDPTHVCFYSAETMHWIAHRFGWTLEIPARNIAIFRKP